MRSFTNWLELILDGREKKNKFENRIAKLNINFHIPFLNRIFELEFYKSNMEKETLHFNILILILIFFFKLNMKIYITFIKYISIMYLVKLLEV